MSLKMQVKWLVQPKKENYVYNLLTLMHVIPNLYDFCLENK